jgi:hypothetical protein
MHSRHLDAVYARTESDECLERLAVLSVAWRNMATTPEGADEFPSEPIEALRRLGVLAAPLAVAEGGLGWGADGGGMIGLHDALRLIGYGNLVVGRLYEAHVNAIRLIQLYGRPDMVAAMAMDVRHGHLFGLWVSPSTDPARLSGNPPFLNLAGMHEYCSAAGFATRALVTACDEACGERMLVIDTARVRVDGAASARLHGMRASATRPVRFDQNVAPGDLVGNPGDYLREPEFSIGAWRTCAVTAGGLQALVDEAVRQLKTRDRAGAPAQRMRIGEMLIAAQTAAMWSRAVAIRLDAAPAGSDAVLGFVNLARTAIEAASLRVIPLVQRSLGLACMTEQNLAEAQMRDLATYLRQPAADDALAQAVGWYASFPSPTCAVEEP